MVNSTCCVIALSHGYACVSKAWLEREVLCAFFFNSGWRTDIQLQRWCQATTRLKRACPAPVALLPPQQRAPVQQNCPQWVHSGDLQRSAKYRRLESLCRTEEDAALWRQSALWSQSTSQRSATQRWGSFFTRNYRSSVSFKLSGRGTSTDMHKKTSALLTIFVVLTCVKTKASWKLHSFLHTFLALFRSCLTFAVEMPLFVCDVSHRQFWSFSSF